MRSLILLAIGHLLGVVERRPTLADIRRKPRASRPIDRTPHHPYHGTESHPIKDALRQRRADNAARNFATGHWQHRVIDAVAV